MTSPTCTPGRRTPLCRHLSATRLSWVLDGPEHLRQRRLLLPPFQGSAVRAFRELIREVAEAEVARWERGNEIVMRDRMRALTFEVICRAVFGVTDSPRIERLRAALTPIMDSGGLTVFLPEPLRRDLGPLSPWGRLQRRRGGGRLGGRGHGSNLGLRPAGNTEPLGPEEAS